MRVLKSLLLLVALFFICDIAIGSLLGYLFHKGYSGKENAIETYAIEKSNEQILVFGSSRASHHYIPALISDSLHQSCYNIGRDGHFTTYQYMLLNCILSRYTPQTIILDINPDEFNIRWDSKDQKNRVITSLLPYIKKNDSARKDLAGLSTTDLILDEVFKTYAYNSCGMAIMTRALVHDRDKDKGFEPLAPSKDMQETDDTGSYKRSNTLIKSFNGFCGLCKAKNIKLIVVTSPTLLHIRNNDISHIHEIADRYNFRYYDFSTDTAFMHPALFHDLTHLSDAGARLFTNKLIAYLH